MGKLHFLFRIMWCAWKLPNGHTVPAWLLLKNAMDYKIETKESYYFFIFFIFFLSSLAVKGNNSVSPCNLTHRQKKIRLGTECFFLLKMVVIQKKLCQATSQVKMFQVVPNLPAYSSFDCVKSAAYVFWPCGHTSLSVKTKPNPFSPCWLNWQQLKPKY